MDGNALTSVDQTSNTHIQHSQCVGECMWLKLMACVVCCGDCKVVCRRLIINIMIVAEPIHCTYQLSCSLVKLVCQDRDCVLLIMKLSSFCCFQISISRQTSRDRKRAKRMVCDCQFDPGRTVTWSHLVGHVTCMWLSAPLSSHTEQDSLEDACGENCLNRLLMIEWYAIHNDSRSA